MLLEAAETVPGYFGFDRTIYDVKATRKKNRKWWDGLKQEQMIDIQTETLVLITYSRQIILEGIIVGFTILSY
jgi:hypothetical protein